MSEGFTVRGFLVAADNKTRRVRLRFSEADWVDFLDEQFPLGGEVYISAKNTAADLAKARQEGRRELAAEIKDAAKLNPAGEEFWSETRDVYIIGAGVLDELLKEAGE
jgi:hypothetical protein